MGSQDTQGQPGRLRALVSVNVLLWHIHIGCIKCYQPQGVSC